MSGKYGIMITITVTGLLLTACSGTRPTHLGIQDSGELAPCPDTPNCVSSFASPEDTRHYIAPFEAEEAQWKQLARILVRTPRIQIIEQDQHYIRAEATTRIMRFVDDLEFLYQPEASAIYVRSASRIGRYDFGVNRKRIEHLREQLID